MKTSKFSVFRVWTVSQAKTHLSDFFRRVEEEGPQQIGKRCPCVVVSANQWYANIHTRKPMGKWLVDNIPQGVNLNIDFDRDSEREIPLQNGDVK